MLALAVQAAPDVHVFSAATGPCHSAGRRNGRHCHRRYGHYLQFRKRRAAGLHRRRRTSGLSRGHLDRRGPAPHPDRFLGGNWVTSGGAIGFNAGFLPSIYASPVDQIVFRVASSNRFSLDDVQATAAVPEARASLMLLAGLASVGGLVKRRLR